MKRTNIIFDTMLTQMLLKYISLANLTIQYPHASLMLRVYLLHTKLSEKHDKYLNSKIRNINSTNSQTQESFVMPNR